MKVAYIICSILYLIFAIVQYNDPDPWLWIMIYVFVAVCFGGAAANKFNRPILWGGIVFCSLYFFFLLPDFIQWLIMGAPTIIESMKAEAPHIELTREFLGLLINIVGLLFLLRQSNKFAHR